MSSNPSVFDDCLVKGSTGCRIPETEHRGITLRQLEDICAHIAKYCKREGWSNYKGKALEPEEVTLYDLTTYVIKPATEEKKCSYVELVAQKKQTPVWFVSHWWGEPVYKFTECLRKHSSDRDLGSDSPYWVCAYANNQWQASDEVGDNPLESSFCRAMKLCQGTVSVLDVNSTCYTRIWCGFEIYISLVIMPKDEEYKYDAYTCIQGDNSQAFAVGLTDGLAFLDCHEYRDGKAEELYEPLWTTYRRRRESDFPNGMIANGLGVSVEDSNASRDEDKTRILNCIRGADNPLETPPASHEAYNAVNAVLRGKFASRGYRAAAERGEDMAVYRSTMERSGLLSAEFAYDDFQQYYKNQEARHFARSLPSTLQRLDLDINGHKFETSDEFALGFGRMKDLRKLKLSCMSYAKLTSAESLWKEMENFGVLRELFLDFKFADELTSMEGLGRAIANMKHLERFSLLLEGSQKLTGGLDSLADGLEKAANLVHLHLDFRFCDGLASEPEGIPKLCRVVAGSTSIEDLNLQLYGIHGIGDLEENWESVADLRAALEESGTPKQEETTDATNGCCTVQ